MRVIGLTGKAASGKNLAADFLREEGYEICDADALARPAIEAVKDKLPPLFGPRAIRDDGSVDRRLVRSAIFSDPEKRKALEGLLHPWIVARCREAIRDAKEPGIVLNAPLLHRVRLDELCDPVIFVDCPEEIRYQRSITRDGMDREAFLAREKAQKDIDAGLIARGRTVYVVKNDGDPENLHRQVRAICDSMGKQVSEHV